MQTTAVIAPVQKAAAPAALRPRVLESSPVHEAGEAIAYDAMVRRHGWLLNAPFVEMVSRAASGLTSGRVLDIGSGPGRIPIALALRHPGWEIVGTDPAADMRAAATAHAAAAGVADRVRFLSGTAERLPFPAGSFDLVISHFALHHVARPERMFDECARVLRGGGKVVIKDLCRQPGWKAALLLAFSRHVLRYDAEQLRMYRESIDAALSFAEARAALKRSKLCMATIRGFRGVDFVIDS
ncbi:MAG: class I SAM-dependent methyltransferase [Planctomycetes bacterium]|nr:class I SAM-dependent methyltransferase [Planctomycetota bacterium]